MPLESPRLPFQSSLTSPGQPIGTSHPDVSHINIPCRPSGMSSIRKFAVWLLVPSAKGWARRRKAAFASGSRCWVNSSLIKVQLGSFDQSIERRCDELPGRDVVIRNQSANVVTIFLRPPGLTYMASPGRYSSRAPQQGNEFTRSVASKLRKGSGCPCD
jgi:hypothetical protein